MNIIATLILDVFHEYSSNLGCQEIILNPYTRGCTCICLVWEGTIFLQNYEGGTWSFTLWLRE
jgi:hypothetical protein